MLNFKDTLTLTKSKMKARKGRTIGTAITMSLGLVVLMSASFAAKGIENTALDLLEAPTNDRWFGVVQRAYEEPEQTFGPVDYESQKHITLEQGQRIAQEFTQRDRVLDTFLRTSITSERGFGLTTNLDSTSNTDAAQSTLQAPSGALDPLNVGIDLSTVDAQFMDFYAQNGISLTEKRDGRIPVLVPSERALLLTDYQAPTNGRETPSREQVEQKNAALQELIGTPVRLQENTFALASQEQEEASADTQADTTPPSEPRRMSVPEPAPTYTVVDHGIELFIAGILPAENFFGGTPDFGTIDLLVAAPFHEEIAQQLNRDRIVRSIVAEYTSEDDIFADMFGEDSPGFFVFELQTIQLSQDEVTVFATADTKAIFDDILMFVRRAGYWVGGFLLLISALLVWMSLGRIVRDSRREIGVFRAVGARKRDVVKIVIMYALIVAVLAFLLSSILSVALTLGISAGWGDQFFYTVASLGNMIEVNPPAFAFFGITPLIVLGSVAATILAACIGAFFPARKAAKLDPVVALRDV